MSEERAAAKILQKDCDDVHHEYMITQDKRLACQDKVIDGLVLQKYYVEQLKENKELNPCTCLVTNCQVSQEAVCFCYNINGNHMASCGCSGPIFLVISLAICPDMGLV